MNGFRKSVADTGINGILFLSLLVLCAVPVVAQEQPNQEKEIEGMEPPAKEWRTMVGVYGGYGLNLLSGELSSAQLPDVIPGTGECGSFQEGSGSGILAGISFEYRFSPTLSGGLRLEYSDRSGDLTYRCVDPAQARMPDGSLATAETEHIAQISLGTTAVDLLLGFRPFAFPLSFAFGPSISFGFGGDYLLTEEIVTPQTAEFVSGGQVRQYGEGNLAEHGSSPGAGLLAAAGYELTAGTSWRLRPELSLAIPLGDDLTAGRIRSTGFRLTLGVMRLFAPEPSVEKIPETPPVVVEVETPAPTPAPFRARIETDNGSGWEEGPLVIRRFIPIRTRLVPLLPYLFFDNRRDELPARYARIQKGATVGFHETDLVKNSTLEAYSQLLNIVGSRMRAYPDATLTLTGTAPDAADGKPSATLAQSRAESIKTYLNRIWEIPNERMQIVPRRDPEIPTNPETAEGRAENRRVELSSNRIEILAPLAFTDTLDPVEKGNARITMESPANGIISWNVAASRVGSLQPPVRSNGKGALPPGYELTLPPLNTFTDPDTLLVAVQVALSSGPGAERTEGGVAKVPVQRDDTYKLQIASGEYSLILFDAANADLGEEHRRVIDAITALLPDDAVVSIRGYTDFLGDSTENQALSERRAQQAALRLRQQGARVSSVQGLGEDTKTFSAEGLPEERMYARRVVIEVSGNVER